MSIFQESESSLKDNIFNETVKKEQTKEPSFISKLGKAYAMQAKMTAPTPQTVAEAGSEILGGATLGLSKKITEPLLPEQRTLDPESAQVFQTIGEFFPIGALQNIVTKGAIKFFPKSLGKRALATIGGMTVAGAGYDVLKDYIDEDKEIDLAQATKSGTIWGGIESLLQGIPWIGTKAKQIIRTAKKIKPTNPEEMANAIDKSISKLELPRITEREGKPFKGIQPKVFGGEIEKVRTQLGEQANKLIEDIKKENLPISKEIESGINIDTRNEELLNKVNQIAKTIPDKQEIKPISDWLKTKRNEIESSPRPTEEENNILKLIRKEEPRFLHEDYGIRMYTFPELIKIYRSFNKDSAEAFKSWIKSGNTDALAKIKFYTGINKEIANLIENQGSKELSNSFKFANEQYSQAKKLEEFDNKLDSFDKEGKLDIKKFYKHTLNPRNENFYTNKIGKEGYNRIKIIANDLKKAEDNLKLIHEIDLNGIIKSSITWGMLYKFLPKGIIAPIKIGKEALALARGYMYLAPKGFKDTHNFLKAIRSGSPKAAANALQKLDEDAQEFENQ